MEDGPDPRNAATSTNTVKLADEDAVIENLFSMFLRDRMAPILPFYDAVFGRGKD